MMNDEKSVIKTAAHKLVIAQKLIKSSNTIGFGGQEQQLFALYCSQQIYQTF